MHLKRCMVVKPCAYIMCKTFHSHAYEICTGFHGRALAEKMKLMGIFVILHMGILVINFFQRWVVISTVQIEFPYTNWERPTI